MNILPPSRLVMVYNICHFCNSKKNVSSIYIHKYGQLTNKMGWLACEECEQKAYNNKAVFIMKQIECNTLFSELLIPFDENIQQIHVLKIPRSDGTYSYGKLDITMIEYSPCHNCFIINTLFMNNNIQCTKNIPFKLLWDLNKDIFQQYLIPLSTHPTISNCNDDKLKNKIINNTYNIFYNMCLKDTHDDLKKFLNIHFIDNLSNIICHYLYTINL